MLYDFHTHTTLSDGDLTPIEMIRRAVVNGYKAVALTDHAEPGTMERIIKENATVCAFAVKYWDTIAIPGIELTHIPASAISEAAKKAKEAGAKVVIIHGESIVEPVEPGTNEAALSCADVDILAHPGLITLDEAKLAAKNSIFLEISARRGHSLTNGHVAAMAQKTGAKLLLGSDAHSPGDLLNDSFAQKVLRGAGISQSESKRILSVYTQELIKRVEG